MEPTRPAFAKKIFGVWWIMAGALWSVLSATDTLIGKYGSPSLQASWNAAWIHPKWGWQVWIIGLLLITVVAVFEGAYRQYRALELAYTTVKENIEGVEATTNSCRQLLLLQVDAFKRAAGTLNLVFEEDQLREFVGQYSERLHAVLDRLTTEGRAKQILPGQWKID